MPPCGGGMQVGTGMPSTVWAPVLATLANNEQGMPSHPCFGPSSPSGALCPLCAESHHGVPAGLAGDAPLPTDRWPGLVVGVGLFKMVCAAEESLLWLTPSAPASDGRLAQPLRFMVPIGPACPI